MFATTSALNRTVEITTHARVRHAETACPSPKRCDQHRSRAEKVCRTSMDRLFDVSSMSNSAS